MNQASGLESLQELLDLVVEGAADVVGFQVAAISLLRSNGDMEIVAVGGHPDATAQLIGRRTPRESLEAEFAVAEHWGSLRFIPAADLPTTAQTGWIAPEWDEQVIGDPDAWDPEDTLLAPFYDPTGEMLGMISVDLPLSAKRPTQVQQGVLEVFANQAGIAINSFRQRQTLAEQVRLAATAQSVARISQGVLEPSKVVEAIVDPIRTGLNCMGLWVRAFSNEDGAPKDHTAAYSAQGSPRTPPRMVELAKRIGERSWADQASAVVRNGMVHPAGVLSDEEAAEILRFLSTTGAGSLLLAPIGAGTECLGHMVLTRAEDAPPWSDAERFAALEIGRDVGRSIVNARLFELERRMTSELRRADRAKTTLFSTVHHELKNPLASIVGHVELLKENPTDDATWSLKVMARNTHRLQSLVDDLLTLSKVSDPDRPLVRERVDISELVRDAADMFLPRATQEDVAIEVVAPANPPTAWGSGNELARLIENLMSNAVKYTTDGGVVTVTLRPVGDKVELVVSDQGLGISRTDLQSLFTEFFRGTNPDALEVPGTGLGLSIVQRIVARHNGTISVDSELGKGTSFTVLLPRADTPDHS
ncbi:ATP-binding protein [Pedococcus sp. KACC 23699]|uniref:histidine kinase n=1 Tax=Pedococcus sp. KACC 23699 TaxID=3149228 RepID=A0AAU7JP75_9MICO